MTRTIRSFIAVDIPEPIKDQILVLINHSREKSGSAVKWVNRDNLHITLKFIGELNIDHTSVIQNDLKELLSSIPSFCIQINRLGIFPNARHPRIFWLGFDRVKDMDLIFTRIEDCIVNLGYDAESKAFSPHLTLGRVRREFSSNDLAEFTQFFLDQSYDFIPDFKVSHMTLFKSELTRDGPVYNRLFQVSLAR